MKHVGLMLSAAFALAALLPSPAMAIPDLQLYVQGGTYDNSSGVETWIVDASSSPLKLWVIGNVNGPGGKGAISDVGLVVSYATTDAPVSLQLTPGTTGGYGGYTDPSTPGTPVFDHSETGTTPSELSSHVVFGSGTTWTQYNLGNFTLQDSQIQDFSNSGGTSLPTAGSTLNGQINVYSITLLSSATGPVSLHFDAFGTDYKGDSTFAPYSHDATANGLGVTPNPEPATITMILSALVPLGVVGLRRLRRRAVTISA